MCRECEVRFICNGGCPKDRIRKTPSGEPGLNYLCQGYKDFFTSIDGPMRMMKKLILQGRSPAEIMNIKVRQSSTQPQAVQKGKRETKRRR
jgi:uncharacterized protein